jgi:hypothetical protein
MIAHLGDVMVGLGRSLWWAGCFIAMLAKLRDFIAIFEKFILKKRTIPRQIFMPAGGWALFSCLFPMIQTA